MNTDDRSTFSERKSDIRMRQYLVNKTTQNCSRFVNRNFLCDSSRFNFYFKAIILLIKARTPPSTTSECHAEKEFNSVLLSTNGQKLYRTADFQFKI